MKTVTCRIPKIWHKLGTCMAQLNYIDTSGWVLPTEGYRVVISSLCAIKFPSFFLWAGRYRFAGGTALRCPAVHWFTSQQHSPWLVHVTTNGPAGNSPVAPRFSISFPDFITTNQEEWHGSFQAIYDQRFYRVYIVHKTRYLSLIHAYTMYTETQSVKNSKHRGRSKGNLND